jgi:hypothetical protein
MKIVFIVLLIAAIGGGVYYYYSSHKQRYSSTGAKELIPGKWKIDSLVLSHAIDSSSEPGKKLLRNFMDSSLNSYEFEFTKDNLVFQTLNGKIQDTVHYRIADAKNILLWSNNDTTKTKWAISKLDTSNLVVMDIDSATFFFKKLK